MDYPFLYSFATSVLQKLDQCKIQEFGDPNDMKKDVEMLKGILTHLPSILDTQKSAISVIQTSVYGLHDLLNEQVHPSYESSWSDLVHPLTEFQDHMHPQSSEKDKNLLSSVNFALPKISSQDVIQVDKLPVPPHLVPCLAYCALYPKGYRIVRETLVNLWMAEGFLELQTAAGSSSGSADTELEDIGNSYFMELLSMGVFVEPMFGFGGNSTNQQAATVHSCKIHPLIHDAACDIAHKEVLVLGEHNSPLDTHTYVKNYIAFHQDFYIPPFVRPRTCMYFVPKIKFARKDTKTYWSNLQILDLAGTQLEELPKSFIHPWSNLPILDLAGTQHEELPKSFINPRKLRYLALSRNTLLKRLDINYWENLQTLAVDGCVQLEKVNLEHTSHLRHLYYTSKKSTLEVHSSSPTLRILQLSYCSELRLLSFSNLANFIALRRLRIFECPRLVSLPDAIDLLPCVEELVFHNCARLDLNYGRSMNSLPSLQYMELIGLPKLTELPAGLQSARALSYLMIADCKSLRSTDHVLQRLDPLQKLCVYDCPNLWIKPNVFQSLTALQSLDIRKCPKITTSTSDAGKDQAPFISHIPEVIFDGQHFLDKKADWSSEIDADLFSAQTDSYLPRNSPYFMLSLETYKAIKTSEGMLDQVYKLKVRSRWVILALALRAISNIRARQRLRLLHCCLFLSDLEFERDTLVHLWMARGLHLEAWEHHANNRFDRLLDEEYIFNSRTDILTGISKYKVNAGKVTSLLNKDKSKDFYTLIEDKNIGVDKSTSWHVSIASKSIDETMFKTLERFSELRTFILIRDYGSSLKQIPSTFFTVHQSMQVLDLSGCHISELPSTIGNMTHLRFLDLSFTLIKRIPESIHFLQELQTLKLKGCKQLHTLPRGMKEIVNLYHLDFDVLGQLTSMPIGLGSLTKLRTLSAFIVSEEDGCSVRELKDMNNLVGSLCISGLEYTTGGDANIAALRDKVHLTGLHLKWNDSKCYNDNDRHLASSALQSLRPRYSSLVELQISYYPGFTLPTWIQHP